MDDKFKSIMSGQLPGAELVLGLVGPVGTNLSDITRDLTKCLGKYKYQTKEIHLSTLIENLVDIPAHNETDAYERTDALMTAGNEARNATGNNAILALAASSIIYTDRDGDAPMPHQAYIINSLKHPDEVNALRRLYGEILSRVVDGPEKRRILRVFNNPSRHETKRRTRPCIRIT